MSPLSLPWGTRPELGLQGHGVWVRCHLPAGWPRAPGGSQSSAPHTEWTAVKRSPPLLHFSGNLCGRPGLTGAALARLTGKQAKAATSSPNGAGTPRRVRCHRDVPD